MFRSWDRRALEGYLEDGMVELEADGEGGGGGGGGGGGVQLACSPAVEAACYRAVGRGVLPLLSRITCPVTVLVGSDSTHLPGKAMAKDSSHEAKVRVRVPRLAPRVKRHLRPSPPSLRSLPGRSHARLLRLGRQPLCERAAGRRARRRPLRAAGADGGGARPLPACLDCLRGWPCTGPAHPSRTNERTNQ